MVFCYLQTENSGSRRIRGPMGREMRSDENPRPVRDWQGLGWGLYPIPTRGE